MSIFQFPDNIVVGETVICIVCRKQITLIEASASLHDADGNLAFTCNGHFWDIGKFIIGLADFMAAERLKQEYGGAADAWALR
ncbi:MAG TPA: hypothetical protein VJP80_03880 [Candidatus Saccharimonadales bacterium]|nr:hypothetical protein [Candidatus Saccharimonadales bacterium]